MMIAVQSFSALTPWGDLSQTYERLMLQGSAPMAAWDENAALCSDSYLKQLPALLKGVSLRRVPRLARLALWAALQLWSVEHAAKSALILTTQYGSVDNTFEFMNSILNDGMALASPTAFSHSVTNMAAAFLSQYLRLTGPCLTFSQPHFINSFVMAQSIIASGLADTVLVGAFEEYSADLARIKKIGKPSGPAEDIAEGAVFFVIGPFDPGISSIALDLGQPYPVNARPLELIIGSQAGPMLLNLRRCGGVLNQALKIALSCMWLNDDLSYLPHEKDRLYAPPAALTLLPAEPDRMSENIAIYKYLA